VEAWTARSAQDVEWESSGLDQSPVIHLAMKPIAIATDPLLHGDIGIRLINRDARDVVERNLDEISDGRVVLRWVSHEARLLHHRRHRRIVIAAGIEDRRLSQRHLEIVVGVVDPASKEVREEGKCPVREAGTPIGTGNLVERDFYADLAQAFLNEHAHWFENSGGACVK
jgi:hypothetical protein